MLDFLLIFAAVVTADLTVEWLKSQFGLFGNKPAPIKVRRTRGPNKPKPVPTPAPALAE